MHVVKTELGCEAVYCICGERHRCQVKKQEKEEAPCALRELSTFFPYNFNIMSYRLTLEKKTNLRQ
jgi:hypothetical protein